MALNVPKMKCIRGSDASILICFVILFVCVCVCGWVAGWLGGVCERERVREVCGVFMGETMHICVQMCVFGVRQKLCTIISLPLHCRRIAWPIWGTPVAYHNY